MNQEIKIKFGSWELLPNGDIYNENTGVWITGERIFEQDWILYAVVQNWDLENFVRVFYEACSFHKIDKITYRFNYL